MKVPKAKNIFNTGAVPYILAGLAIFALVFFGSVNKTASSTSSLSMASIASNDFSVSADQLSEFYVVASLANSLNLNSSEIVASNYVVVSSMLESGQSSTEKIEKPTIVNTSHLSRGIITYTVKAGESMEAIAAAYGLTTDQVRWSNGLKTTALDEGQTLYLPNVNGIIYTVKSGDNVAIIASRYGSSAELITTYNDLETDSSLVEGQKLVLPQGTLPETERPEYVAPVVIQPVYTYTYAGSNGSRQNIRYLAYGFYVPSAGNPGVPGQCTWYAWYMRSTDANSLGTLPGGLGNANSWAYQLSAAGYRVDHTPEAGAVFQTSSGWYGHVGYVMAVHADGSITIREMNYNYSAYTVTEAEISAATAASLNYIH
ncbi:LysM peptidoglycan-binding domain-containing protein [Candidatus Saccharibacteria bacterium]|nr:LysM peptidoglycan-binding domain-containing protein [Candidatus Saccharibacteria bacterium]